MLVASLSACVTDDEKRPAPDLSATVGGEVDLGKGGKVVGGSITFEVQLTPGRNLKSSGLLGEIDYQQAEAMADAMCEAYGEQGDYRFDYEFEVVEYAYTDGDSVLIATCAWRTKE